jgi:hypothetical protein
VEHAEFGRGCAGVVHGGLPFPMPQNDAAGAFAPVRKTM